MHRDQEDPIGRRLVAIEQDHPRPWAKHEPGRSPSPFQLNASQGECFEDSQRARKASPSVAREAKSGNRLLDIPFPLRGDDDLRHSGKELVERRSFAARGLREALLGPLPRARN
jgi:hypothetical protein